MIITQESTEATLYFPLDTKSNSTKVASFLLGYTKNIMEPMVVIEDMKALVKDKNSPG